MISSTRPVSRRTLMRRINRQLAKENEKLRVARCKRDRMNLGEICIIEADTERVVHVDVDLRALARRLAVLGEHEQLAMPLGSW